MDPALDAETATAKSSQRLAEHQSGQPDAEAEGQIDASPPAAAGAEGSHQEPLSSTSSLESPRQPAGADADISPRMPALDASDEAPALPDAEQRSPKSVLVPALVVAAVVLLIVSVVVSSLIWGGPARPTDSPSNVTTGGAATLNGTASLGASTTPGGTAISGGTATSSGTTTPGATAISGGTATSSKTATFGEAATLIETATSRVTEISNRTVTSGGSSTSGGTAAPGETATSRGTRTSVGTAALRGTATIVANATSGRTETSSGHATSGATDVPIDPTLLCPAIPNLSPDAAVVSTTAGRLVGRAVSVGGVRMRRWLGVPYAESTAEKRRFAEPVPISMTDKCVVVDAVDPRPPCAQWVQGKVLGDEDCLRFNIWAPAETASPTAKRSLVLAATGHWFQRGTNDVPQWQEVAAHAGVVLMAPNVRLGVLGFLHTNVTGIAKDVGQQDAIAAIRWARDNAAAFGADPSVLMLVCNGTGGYLLTEAAGRLNVSVSRAVLEGPLYTSVVPINAGGFDPSKDLVSRLGCNAADRSTWSACLSNASLEVLLKTAAAMPLRFAPFWTMSVIAFRGYRVLPSFTDFIGGADIAQARNLVEEYIRPTVNTSTDAELLDASLQYLIGGNKPVIKVVKKVLKSGTYEQNLLSLALAVSGCATRTAANAASRGHHYVVDSGSQPLFEPVLNTADVVNFLVDGMVPRLKNGSAWPSSKTGTRFLFANGTEAMSRPPACTAFDRAG